MQNKHYILLLLLLLLPRYVFACSNDETPLSGFVIFNESQFEAKPNSISVNGILTIIVNEETESTALILFSPKKESLINDKPFENINAIVKTTTQQKIKEDKKIEKVVASSSNVAIPFNQSPYDGRFGYLFGATGGISILLIKENNKKNINPVQFTVSSFQNDLLIEQTKKLLFQSQETIFISKYYSKTSRIRPPPNT